MVVGGEGRSKHALQTALYSESGISIIGVAGLCCLERHFPVLPTVYPYERGPSVLPSMTVADRRGGNISHHTDMLTAHILAPWESVMIHPAVAVLRRGHDVLILASNTA